MILDDLMYCVFLLCQASNCCLMSELSNDIQCIPREAKIPSSAFQRFLASRCSFSKVFAGPS